MTHRPRKDTLGIDRYDESFLNIGDETPDFGQSSGAAEKFDAESDNVMRDLGLPHAASDTSPHVTVSIGAASLPASHNATPGQLIAAADAALYEAKRQGRNRVVASRGPQPPGEAANADTNRAHVLD